MLPQFDDDTLSSYLLSAACSIHEQVNGGADKESATRLREAATIIARVAQQLSDRQRGSEWSAAEEASAIEAAHGTFAIAEARRVQSGIGPKASSARSLDAVARRPRNRPGE